MAPASLRVHQCCQDGHTLGVVGSVFAEHQYPFMPSTQQSPTLQVGGRGKDRLSHFPTVAHTGPGFQSTHGAHCLTPGSGASRSLGRGEAGQRGTWSSLRGVSLGSACTSPQAGLLSGQISAQCHLHRGATPALMDTQRDFIVLTRCL